MIKRKRIAIFTMDAKLGTEIMGATRYSFLAELFSENGYEVDLITSAFQHWEHKQRDVSSFTAENEAYHILFIDEPGYQKDLGLARILSHKVASRNLAAYFEKNHDYDLIYCQIPPNDVALSAARAAEKYSIPLIVDVNDLWPEAFRVAVDMPVVSDIAFSPFFWDAKRVYNRASAIVGTSEEYVARGFKDRQSDMPHVVMYVGNIIRDFDNGVGSFQDDIEKPTGEFWVTYAGSLGDCYDLGTLIRAVDEAHRSHDGIVVKLLGDGPCKADLISIARSVACRVDFAGYQPYEKMAAYLSKSDIVVNSLTKKAAQSIVTKIGDYLASGKPMINTSASPEFCAKVEADGFGLNVEAGDSHALSRAILYLYDNPSLRDDMGRRGRAIAEAQFDRPQSYLAVIRLADSLIENREVAKRGDVDA